MYHGFYTLKGRKFPNGNFRTSVFCEVKTQIVGKTLVFRQAQEGHFVPLFDCFGADYASAGAASAAISSAISSAASSISAAAAWV